MSDSAASVIQITFHSIQVPFDLNIAEVKEWLAICSRMEGLALAQYSVVICDDQYLLDLNQQYLNHDELTDIITFDYRSSESENTINGEAYISFDRIRENAVLYDCSPKQELLRVIVHGLLHLCGHGDKGPEEKKKMRALEDQCLAKHPSRNPE
ncbi:MAG: rRNA maturation RNase YbeY [Saprospiraceae bacterium]|nr:rRNA maturation RNase YbeY [Saprospiraceae bacterium]